MRMIIEQESFENKPLRDYVKEKKNGLQSRISNQKSRGNVGGFVIARILTVAVLTASAIAQSTVHYTANNANVKYLFATAQPVAHLKSGDILDTNTLDCFGNVIRKPGDTLSMVKGDNPLTGPFFVEGAEPGDTLAVKILDLQVDGDTGVGAFAPGFGALNETNYTPMLHTPLPEKIWFYHIDHASNTAAFKALDSDFSVKIPLHPFFGCIGVAPAEGEARSSVVPAEFGGNMDSPEASVGNTVYFPVNVKGGLFYIGDGHGAMGDGEIAGTAIEVPLKARVQLSVIKGRTIAWPQFEDDDAIMTVGDIARWMTRCELLSPSLFTGFIRTTDCRSSTPMNSCHK